MEKIQDIAVYQGLARRTFKDLGSDQANGRHMNQGIKTEVGEAIDCIKKTFAYGKDFDKINFGEELADAAWYIMNNVSQMPEGFDLAAHAKEIDSRVLPMVVVGYENVVNDPLYKAEMILDIVLSEYMYFSKVLAPYFSSPITHMALLMIAAETLELDFYQLLTANIEKLKARYPEKYTDDAAINRDVVAERVVLDATVEVPNDGDAQTAGDPINLVAPVISPEALQEAMDVAKDPETLKNIPSVRRGAKKKTEDIEVKSEEVLEPTVSDEPATEHDVVNESTETLNPIPLEDVLGDEASEQVVL